MHANGQGSGPTRIPQLPAPALRKPCPAPISRNLRRIQVTGGSLQGARSGLSRLALHDGPAPGRALLLFARTAGVGRGAALPVPSRHVAPASPGVPDCSVRRCSHWTSSRRLLRACRAGWNSADSAQARADWPVNVAPASPSPPPWVGGEAEVQSSEPARLVSNIRRSLVTCECLKCAASLARQTAARGARLFLARRPTAGRLPRRPPLGGAKRSGCTSRRNCRSVRRRLQSVAGPLVNLFSPNMHCTDDAAASNRCGLAATARVSEQHPPEPPVQPRQPRVAQQRLLAG